MRDKLAPLNSSISDKIVLNHQTVSAQSHWCIVTLWGAEGGICHFVQSEIGPFAVQVAVLSKHYTDRLVFHHFHMEF